VFLEKILEGLSWGLFVVAILVPIASFNVAWSWLGPILRRSKEEELELLTDFLEEEFEEEPPLPENEELQRQRYRFTASTIVRPPNVIRRKDNENED
jgi:hypothetical protein